MSHLGQQVEQRHMFFPGGIEEGYHVSFGDYQGVTGGNREAIKNGHGIGIGSNDSRVVKGAEGACFGIGHSGLLPVF